MKRVLLALAVAAVTVAGTGVAWAHSTDEDRAARREAVRACREQARQAQPEADRQTVRADVRECLEAQGITPRPHAAEHRERRAQFRDCVKKAREEHPGAERPTIREAVRDCTQRA